MNDKQLREEIQSIVLDHLDNRDIEGEINEIFELIKNCIDPRLKL